MGCGGLGRRHSSHRMRSGHRKHCSHRKNCSHSRHSRAIHSHCMQSNRRDVCRQITVRCTPSPPPPPLLMAPRRRVVGYRILSLWKSVQSAVTSHRAAGVARTPPVGLATPKASLRRQRWGTAVPWPGGGGAHPARQWKNLPEAVWGHLLDI